MPKDFSNLTMPMLFLSGSNDKMMPAEKLEKAKSFLPKETVFISVEGGNHKNFALYSHQFFDGDASIEQEQQIDEANALTLPFIEKLTGQK
jgi:pimeloyl-ACP methyl ester carboxylesterase